MSVGEPEDPRGEAPARAPGARQERAWVARAAAGDAAAFERLYRLHCGRIHALCWRLCGGDAALAEDLVQEAFVRAWIKLDQFEGKSAFGTWLHRLAANVALSDRRSRLRRVQREMPTTDAVERTATGDADVRAPLSRDLERAIGGLPERARTVLVLFDIEGYAHQEIAEMTGMAEGSSKAQLHRARKLLREALEA
ncbi:MAG: RNA polymerase sigma factor [Gammaproteobacteria bacterium]